MQSTIQIREATHIEQCAWDELVSRFENARVYHKTAWLHSLQELTGAQPLYLILERDGEIIGCLPGFLRRFGFIRVFCSPLEGWQTESMGPAFDSTRVSTTELMSTLVPWLEKRFRIHHVEMVSSELASDEMRDLGFEGRPIFSYRATLYPGNDEAAFRKMKSNARNHVRKAIKLGLTAHFETDESFVRECYDQMKEVFHRRGASVPFSEARVHCCFRAMKASGNLLAISVRTPDGTCIATGLYLVDGRELILWSWTHRTQYRSYCPTELLTWVAMQKASQMGCTVFDMTGGGEAKPKFGAEPYQKAWRWMRSRHPWIAQSREIAKRTYRLQQVVRGQLARRFSGAGTGVPQEPAVAALTADSAGE